MTQSMPKPVVLHHYLKTQIGLTGISGSLLLMAITVFVFCVSNNASAGPRKHSTATYTASSTSTNANTEVNTNVITDSLKDLPVVKLQQTDSLAQTMAQISTARVVLVGETHTRWDHHLVQLEILKLLYQKSPRLAIGVEWFQQPFQEHLDAYVAGEISEQEMLRLTGYFERWRYDYRLYRPILQYAREHRIPVIALNASQELSTALSKTGFDDLPAELKEQLPESYDWSDKDYEQRLRNIFDEHPDNAGDFEQFHRGQLTWDESMAERAVRYLKENPESRLLVLAGSGHIMYGSGIPNRIKRRIDVEQFSILVSEDFLSLSENIADFLVLSAEQSLQPVGLIGALLETEGKLVMIKGFSDNSAIKDAGLPKGAVIIKVDDTKVESFADFKMAIIDKKPGERVDLFYLENAESGSKDVKSINLELR
jgi:uncharacterized iron-regulated protein